MSDTPLHYEEGKPRVSDIVEWAYPFNGEARERFEDWLWKLHIDTEDYMGVACEGGSYVHKRLEDTINSTSSVEVDDRYEAYVSAGKSFLSDYSLTEMRTEVYVSSKEYQGTADLIGKLDGKPIILDWKTYGLAKDVLIGSGKYKKPSEKLKKARLQLSLYGEVLGIDELGVVQLLGNGEYKLHKLEKIPSKEIKKLLKNYKLRYVDEI